MSITPVSPSRPVDNSVQHPAQPIELSFSSGPGGAWDDRELINAANSAMKEFHTHHPGPGSWLDKATAAMALGRPLPGANDYGSAWYTASAPAAPVEETSSAAPPKKKRKTVKKPNAVNPYDPVNTTCNSIGNGAGPSGTALINRNGRASPVYQPPSPDGQNAVEQAQVEADEQAAEDAEWGDVEENWDEEDEEEGDWETEDYTYPRQAGPVQPQPAPAAPAYGVYPAADISRDEALGHAMTAQYWAGYWMGIAQTKEVEEKKRRRKPPRPDKAMVEEEPEQQQPSNVIVTKHQYSFNMLNGLKR
ncbi:hypothetical protein I312_105985 [Cryptococcus bacillisporus CA1280]|uniref:uncharacterized protein n=1 Tax=Cryptococcus bacillisporus CA1280 TaxID=1296109 RepID=UPI0033677D9C